MSAVHFCNGRSSIPSSTSIRSPSISFQTLHLPPLSALLSMDGQLRWIGTPWHGFAPHSFIPCSSITIITPLAHPALHIRHFASPGGTPLVPANSSYCLSNSTVICHELTSQFLAIRYHQSSQTTLEFNFTHLPAPNHSDIQRDPPVSSRRWWILYSCVCQPWSDGGFSGWHWDNVRLISFDWLVGLLFQGYLISFVNHLSFSLVLLNAAMQTIECWMRCWVL